MKQNEAVISFTRQALGDDFQVGVSVSSYITQEQRRQIAELMVDGFRSGDVELKERSVSKLEDDKALRAYASSVVTNWINKSKELNGGSKYEIKNPGTRTNPQIKQATSVLKELIASGAEEAQINEVNSFIVKTRAELMASKPVKQPRQKKTKQIDLSSLPEQFHSLVG